MSTDSAVAPDYSPPTGPVVARAGSYYRNVRYLMAVLGIGMGLYFLYDGYYTYPKENREAEQKSAGTKLPHSDLDVRLQYLFGYGMFPVVGGLLAFWLHRSRGELRLDGDVVSIPGHPPFRLSDVTEVNKRLWDRKGIAYISYKTVTGEEGSFRLDDFIYERKPTDLIYEAIINNLEPPTQSDAVAP
jgi:hypothetical protein